MASFTPITRALLIVAAFVFGQLGVIFLGLALSAVLGFSSSGYVWAVPASAVFGVILIAVACALTFILSLDD